MSSPSVVSSLSPLSSAQDSLMQLGGFDDLMPVVVIEDDD